MYTSHVSFKKWVAAALFGATAVVHPLSAISQQPHIATTHRISLPVGTVVPVRLNEALSSKTAQVGDKFTATVKSGPDDGGLPDGTKFEGVVIEAIPSASGKPGVLDVDFKRAIFPGGTTKAIVANLYTLDGKAVRHENGRLVASADKRKDRLKWVGIGAGAGLVLSKVIKGNTLVDTVLGAGAGYLFNELTNKKPGDVNLKLGAVFGVRMDKEFAFSPDGATTNRQTSVDSRTNTDRNDNSNRVSATQTSISIGVMIDDTDVKFDGSAVPYQRGEIIYVPLAACGRAGSFDYKYSASTKLISARNGSVRLTVGSRIAIVNGERKRLPASAEVTKGNVYVPMQFLAYAAFGKAAWDADSKTVIVTTDQK